MSKPNEDENEDNNLDTNLDVNYDAEFDALVQSELKKEEKRVLEHSESIMRFPLTSSLDIPAIKFPKDKDGDSLPISAAQLGDAILERVPMAKTPNNTLYFYKNGVYIPNGEQATKEIIVQLLHHGDMMKCWNAEYIGLVINYIVTVTPLLWEKPLDTRINLLNGIYDCVSQELMEHTYQYLSTVQLPINYDKHATCMGMEKFVREVFPEDAQHVAWEIMAWVITSSNEGQNLIILNGSGSNGKSTFLNAIENLLGKNNVSHVSLQRLETDKFAPARLYQKLANICADLPNTKLNSTLVFKSITGGDGIEIEFKNKTAFSSILFSKLLFSTNELPRTADTSEGFYRKITIIPFNATFTPNPKKAKELKLMICDPDELSGMLNNALEALPSVLVNGIRITKSMQEAHEEFREATDPMVEWIDDTLETFTGSFVKKEDLYFKYKEFCKLSNAMPRSKEALGRMVKKLRPNIKDRVVSIDNHSFRVWIDVKLKDLAEITVQS